MHCVGPFPMPIWTCFLLKASSFLLLEWLSQRDRTKLVLIRIFGVNLSAQQHDCKCFCESLLSGKVEDSKSWVSLVNLIVCASAMITFQICSVLCSKLNSPAYLQENKCTSYCRLESASWAVCFQWACCDFVLTDWAVFHFAFIFHPVRRIFSAFFFPSSPASCCLYGSVHWSSDSLSSALLVCSFSCHRGLSWTFPTGSSGQTLAISVGSIFCHGQDVQESW